MQKSDWKKCRLGDICALVIDHRGKTPKKLGGDWEPVPFGYRALSAKNIKMGQIVQEDSIKYVNESLYKKWMKDEIQYGDILITSEAPFGQVYLWNSHEKIVLSQRLFGLRIKKSFSPRFIYYYMTTQSFQAELEARSTGTTVIGLRQPELLKCSIAYPPDLEEQKKIAGILGALDDKIELLQKQNKTLEDMAKAIFKSWFVDFDVVHAKQKGLPKADIMREYHLTDELYDLFPSDFENSSLGPIPSGWQVKTVQDLAKVSSGKRPQSAQDKKSLTYNIAVYGGNGIKWWTKTPLYTTPIIITGRVGTLGQVYRIYDPVWISDNALVFETHLDNFEYLFYMLKNVDFASFNRGSTQPLITQGDIKNISLVYSAEIIKEFHNIVVEYEKKILLNNKQIQTLTELRDTLLPPLISGKIRV